MMETIMAISPGYTVTQIILLLNERLSSVYSGPSAGWQGTQSKGAFDSDQSNDTQWGQGDLGLSLPDVCVKPKTASLFVF